jgi:hypothetical protein
MAGTLYTLTPLASVADDAIGQGEDPRLSAVHSSPYQVYTWASVLLHQALCDLRHSATRAEAIAWFDDESRDAGSFFYCCSILGFDATELREKITAGEELLFSLGDEGASEVAPDSD